MESRIRKQNSLATDILVAGGGIAGVCTALAAARCGAKVILCQDRPVLGGNASSEIRMHICGADFSGCRGKELEVEARETGIIEEIRLENAARNPQKSWSMLDLILYEKCIQETNLTLLLNSSLTAAEVDKVQTIRCVLAERQSTEDEFSIYAKIFIDCTGDGRLGVEAGALFRRGRESKKEFGESMALEVADEKTLGSTLLFETRDMGHPVPFQAPDWARKFQDEDLRLRSHATFRSGFWWIEWGGHLDTIKDNEAIRHELLRILLGVWDHIKNGGDHGAENFTLDWFGFLPGKRESRRFVGLYTFTERDALETPHFEDAIAYGGWPLDTHPPDGIDAPREEACKQPILPYLYSIPLRCCISRNIKNLMFAGRNLSASHVGFSSLRVMGTCGAVGQGVGTAAAYAVRHGLLPEDLIHSSKALPEIQSQLLDDDCFLPGVDSLPDTLLLPDAVFYSSATEDGKASQVLHALNRAVYGPGGIHPRYQPKGTNRWISEESQGFPAYIEFDWEHPVTISKIVLVFDSGLHRPLVMTHDASCETLNRNLLWHIPPELIWDYQMEYRLGDSDWVPLLREKDNYQRLRKHSFGSITANTLRLTVLSTHGCPQARVIRMTCY